MVVPVTSRLHWMAVNLDRRYTRSRSITTFPLRRIVPANAVENSPTHAVDIREKIRGSEENTRRKIEGNGNKSHTHTHTCAGNGPKLESARLSEATSKPASASSKKKLRRPRRAVVDPSSAVMLR